MVEAPLTDVPRKRARTFLKVFHFRQAATPLSYPKNPTPAWRSPVSSPSIVRGSFFTLLLAASSNPPPFCDVHSLSAPRLRRPYFSTSIFLPPFEASPAMKNSCHRRLPPPLYPPPPFTPSRALLAPTIRNKSSTSIFNFRSVRSFHVLSKPFNSSIWDIYFPPWIQSDCSLWEKASFVLPSNCINRICVPRTA